MASGTVASELDGHQFQRPSSTTSEGTKQRPHQERVHEDPDRHAVADLLDLRAAGPAAGDREDGEGAAEDDTRRGHRAAGTPDRARDGLAAAAGAAPPRGCGS